MQPQQSNPIQTIYQQVHQAQSAMTQGTEWYHTQLLNAQKQIVMLQGEIDQLQKKLEEANPNKKLPNSDQKPKTK